MTEFPFNQPINKPPEREKEMTNQKPQSKQLQIANYVKSPAVVARFAELLNEKDAQVYVADVLLAVADNPQLQTCTPRSIVESAFRAASFRLRVGPTFGQAYIVPYKNTATFQPGYKGLYEMAIRTGLYRYINVHAVGTGGNVQLHPESGFLDMSTYEPGMKVNKDIKNLLGFLCSFEMLSGMKKTIWVTKEDIEQHKKDYAKGTDRSDSAWKKAPYAMYRKTALRMLLAEAQLEITNQDSVIDLIEADEAPVPEASDFEEGDFEEVDEEIFAHDLTGLIRYFKDAVAEMPEKATATKKQRGLLAQHLNALGNGNENRKAFIGAVFNVNSLTKLSGAEVLVCLNWLALEKDSEGNTLPSELAAHEFTNAVETYMHREGATE